MLMGYDDLIITFLFVINKKFGMRFLRKIEKIDETYFRIFASLLELELVQDSQVIVW
jgi:hypothetical protein